MFRLVLLVAVAVLASVLPFGNPFGADPGLQPSRTSRILTTKALLEPAAPVVPVLDSIATTETETGLPPAPVIPAAAPSAPAIELNETRPTLAAPPIPEWVGDLAGYSSQPAREEARFLFFSAPADGDNSISVGNLRAGYGQVFGDETVLSRGRNGTAWEEPGVLYVKASFRF